MTTDTKTKKHFRDVLGPHIDNLTFGSYIRHIRICDDISQSDMANKLGISRQFLCAIESGKSQVGIEFAKRVADAFGYSEALIMEVMLKEQFRRYNIKLNVYVTQQSQAAA